MHRILAISCTKTSEGKLKESHSTLHSGQPLLDCKNPEKALDIDGERQEAAEEKSDKEERKIVGAITFFVSEL